MSAFGTLQTAYVGITATDRVALDEFFATTIGLEPGAITSDGRTTWRNDAAVHRILVAEGAADGADLVGIEANDAATFDATLARLAAAGFTPVDADAATRAARRVAAMAHVEAPWGVRFEIVLDLERDGTFSSSQFPGGFVTDGVGFGHVVFATSHLADAHRFVVDGLGLAQSDWIETELAPGVPLEVRFYHCNGRHHSLAVAGLPFEAPAALHHLMLETNELDDTGRAFDRALASGRPIANALGRHDNDGMTSFYVVSPAGFQVEVGWGARVVTEPWGDNHRYDAISRWGHQPVPAPTP